MDMGFDDRVKGDLDTTSTPTGRVLAVKKTELIDLLRKNELDFNRHAKKCGLPIRISTKHVQLEVHANPGKFKHFFNRQDDRGVLHKEQIYTIIDCFIEVLRDPTKCGLLLGALQAGKSNTIIALQWIGPIFYLLTGRKIYPLYLITSQKSHEAQAKEELALFLRWYGEVQLIRSTERTILNAYRKLQLDIMFLQNPTLNTYREVVLDGAEDDITEFSPEDFVNRRVHGQQVEIIAGKCKKAINAGYDPLLFLDEGQFGASDRENKDDTEVRKPCVSRQILDAIAAELGRRPRYIVASATPYEFVDADVWTVNQYLGETYCGLNMFGGRVIAENMKGKIHVPQVTSFEECGQEYDLPLFAAGQFSIATWALKLRDPTRAQSRFERWCKRSGYEGTYDEYQIEVESEVRSCIHRLIEREHNEPVTERYLRTRWPSLATDRNTLKRVAGAYARPVGICIRLCNNNRFTDTFIARLRLDTKKIEVLSYYTQYDEHGKPLPEAKSVKQFLKRRKRPDLPFVLFVTARARMGDAFPLYVKYFLECSMIASDLNALLQGLLGRSCGYFKIPTVIMSHQNWGLVMEFVSTNGGHIYTPSRHSTVVGLRRGPFTNILKIPSDNSDPMIQKFLKQLHKHIVETYVHQDRSTLQTRRSKGTRYAPILKIADRLELFSYLERNRTRLFPQYATRFEIPREHDEVKNREFENRRFTSVASDYTAQT
jgi:hypothetical protein